MTITSQQLRELAEKATQEDMRVIRVKGHTHSQAWNKGICAEGEDADCDLIAALWNNRETLLTALELQERLDKVETVEVVARALAKGQGLNFDEVCGYETEADECNSATCVAAYYEDHDPAWARDYFLREARSAINAMKGDSK